MHVMLGDRRGDPVQVGPTLLLIHHSITRFPSASVDAVLITTGLVWNVTRGRSSAFISNRPGILYAVPDPGRGIAEVFWTTRQTPTK
jgi:hypothetical protein